MVDAAKAAGCAVGITSNGDRLESAIEWIVATSRGPLALDSSHARNELGWQPSRDAEQVLVDFARRD